METQTAFLRSLGVEVFESGHRRSPDAAKAQAVAETLEPGATVNGVAALVQSVLNEDPFAGTVFVFRAKRTDRLKILFWNGSGLVMAYKRLEETTVTWPAVRDGVMSLNRAQFEVLFGGLDWRRVKAPETRRPAAAE